MFIADASSAHKIQATAQVCAFYWVVEEAKCKIQNFQVQVSVKSHRISQFTENVSMGKERKSEMLILL